MPLKVTLDIFSGRPNPVLMVDEKDIKKILDKIDLSGKSKAISSKTTQQPG